MLGSPRAPTCPILLFPTHTDSCQHLVTRHSRKEANAGTTEQHSLLRDERSTIALSVSFLARMLALAVSIALLSVSISARSAPSDPPAAEALFRAGRSAFDRGDYADALRRFSESYLLEPAVGTLLNIASTEEKLGRRARAWEHYSQVLGRLSKGDERMPMVKRRLQQVEGELAWLTLELAPGSPIATTVERGGVSLGEASFGVPLPVDPGVQEILVSAPGRSANQYRIELRQGDRETLSVEPGPEELKPRAAPGLAPAPSRVEQHSGKGADPPRSSPEPWRPSSAGEAKTQETVGYALLGGGAAAAAVGAVMGVLVLEDAATVDEHCQNKVCDSEGLAAGRTGKVFGTVGIVAAALGAVSVGVGSYLLLSANHSRAEIAVKGSF